MNEETDLWNTPLGAFKGKRKTPKPQGHAGKPGTGPAGQTCKTCEHLTRLKMGKTYLKCSLTRASWTSGQGSDVRAGDAACWKWEAIKPD
jgi:hypothetical protein